jgi:hypothetical protein
MSRKSRERRKAKEEAKDSTPSTTPNVVKRRRRRRLIFVALIGISFPILELIAYQFRVITVTIINRSNQPITDLLVSYSGGSFDAPELKAGGSITRLIRPDFNFKGERFATYLFEIHFKHANGIGRQKMWPGTIDFSAQETYTVEPMPLEGGVQVKHTTTPGFPLSVVRNLLDRLGIG